jgi:lipoprotein-anchoring transpeptidase ErfK/SrfK
VVTGAGGAVAAGEARRPIASYGEEVVSDRHGHTSTLPALAAAVVVVLLAAGGAAAVALNSREGAGRPVAVAAGRSYRASAEREAAFVPRPGQPMVRHTCPTAPAVLATSATAAHAVVASVAVYAAPGDGAAVRSVSNPTFEGEPLVFLALTQRGAWTKVLLPERPNGSTAWIHAADVAQVLVPYRVVVETCRKRLTVWHLGRIAFRTTVAVGAPEMATPLGAFYVDYVTQERASGAYGPWLLSLAGFSNVLQDFGGGRGQIALHGTNHPDAIGRAISHGCVRLRNNDITRLHDLLVPGTPVSVLA